MGMFARNLTRVPRFMPLMATAQPIRGCSSDSIKKRERGMEEVNIRNHEKETIRRLQEQIAKMEAEQAAKDAKAAPPPPPAAPATEVNEAPEDLKNKVKSLEDEVVALRRQLSDKKE